VESRKISGVEVDMNRVNEDVRRRVGCEMAIRDRFVLDGNNNVRDIGKV